MELADRHQIIYDILLSEHEGIPQMMDAYRRRVADNALRVIEVEALGSNPVP